MDLARGRRQILGRHRYVKTSNEMCAFLQIFQLETFFFFLIKFQSETSILTFCLTRKNSSGIIEKIVENYFSRGLDKTISYNLLYPSIIITRCINDEGISKDKTYIKLLLSSLSNSLIRCCHLFSFSTSTKSCLLPHSLQSKNQIIKKKIMKPTFSTAKNNRIGIGIGFL